MTEFPDISLLTTHYNRSKSLERLLNAFAALNVKFGDTVVSDDGSNAAHAGYLEKLREELPFSLVTTPKNRGLGHNFNKGQDAVQTRYTLCVQEDFVPNPEFVPALANALGILEEDPDLDMARFYAYFKYPLLKPYRDGFSRMEFRGLAPGYKKFYAYSDHPHLRRTTFFEKFGRYPEGLAGDATEYHMMISFLKNKGKGVFYEDFTRLFTQANSADEPSTMRRNYWRETDNAAVVAVRHLYRHIKMNFDYLRGTQKIK